MHRFLVPFLLSLNPFLIGFGALHAQPTTFEKTYDFGYSEIGNDLVETDDGGFFIVGAQTRAINYTNMLTLKTDSLGDLQWSKIIGSGGNTGMGGEWGIERMVKISDSVFFVAGNTNVGTSGPADRGFFLAKMNGLGDTLWTRLYNPGTSSERLFDLIATPDSGFLLAGYSPSFDNAYIIKTDINGDTLWTRTWRGPYGEGSIYGIINTMDGGYAATGPVINEHGDPFFDMFLLKMDSLGKEDWVRFYKGHDTWNGSTYGYDLVQLQDSGFVLAGITTTYHEDIDFYAWDAFVLRTNKQGDSLWSFKRGGTKSDGIKQIIFDSSDIIAVGTTFSNSKGSSDIQILSLKDSGKLNWISYYGGVESETVSGLDKPSNGGYTIIGRTKSDCSSCVYLIKTDSMGCVVPGCQSVGTANTPPTQDFQVVIYPNPATNYLLIETGSPALKDLRVCLTDIMGRQVLQKEISSRGTGKQAHQMFVGNLPRGIYILSVLFSTGESQDFKIILQ